MKTADLIPLILLELNIEDKYGLDLSKSIETKSKGKIVIKQPTLYTILKKLEKNRFITSYWQDSEIGGKRHYYKITSNGRMQVSTLPSFETLVQNILLSENVNDTETESTDNEITPPREFKSETQNPVYTTQIQLQQKAVKSQSNSQNNNYSIFDLLDNTEDSPETKESIVPSEEVFTDTSIDTATELEINKSNTSLLKDEKTKTDETFASNESVAKFAEHTNATLSDEYKEQLKSIYEIQEIKQTKKQIVNQTLNYTDIKYVDYNDIKSDKKHITAKQTCKNILYKILSTCAYLLVVLILGAIVTSFTGKTPFYYVMAAVGVLALIFYPTIYAFNYEKLRLKFVKHPYKLDIKKRSLILCCIEIAIILVTFIINICIGQNTMSSLFGAANFGNLYAVLLMSFTLFADLLFTYLFLVRKK